MFILEEQHFVEDIGLYFERMGLPRMAGRVLGVLLISDPPAQSLTDLTSTLQASKSAVSTAARLLVEAGLIEQVPSPLPRRVYFRFKPGGWLLFMRQWVGVMGSVHRITERGLDLLKDKPPELRDRLLEAHDLFSFMEDEVPSWLERWEKMGAVKSKENK